MAVVSIVLLVPRAHAQLATGRSALDEADFQRAIRAFDRAERSERLDRDGLVSLFEGRVIARFALGARGRAHDDLVRLASIDPAHTFPVEAPPEVAAAFREVVTEAGGGLGASLVWSDGTDTSTLRVTVVRDPGSLVRAVRVRTRVGERVWRTTQVSARGGEVPVPHPPELIVSAYAELLGARDVVLGHEGSAEEPVRNREPPRPVVVAPVEVAGGDAVVTTTDATEETEEAAGGGGGDEVALAVGLGVGGAALVAVAVVLGVVFGGGTSDRTQPMSPIVVGF